MAVTEGIVKQGTPSTTVCTYIVQSNKVIEQTDIPQNLRPEVACCGRVGPSERHPHTGQL